MKFGVLVIILVTGWGAQHSWCADSTPTNCYDGLNAFLTRHTVTEDFSWPHSLLTPTSRLYSDLEREALVDLITRVVALAKESHIKEATLLISSKDELKKAGIYLTSGPRFTPLKNTDLESADAVLRKIRVYGSQATSIKSKRIVLSRLHLPAEVSEEKKLYVKLAEYRLFELALEELIHCAQDAFGNRLSQTARQNPKLFSARVTSPEELEVPFVFWEWGLATTQAMMSEYQRPSVIEEFLNSN